MNKKNLFIGLILIALFGIFLSYGREPSNPFSPSDSSSSPAIAWQKCFGGSKDDEAKSIQQTSDGGFIVAGKTWSNDGDVTGNHGDGDVWEVFFQADFWVVKLSATGEIQWQKCLGGSDYDWVNSIQQTSDGGFIIAGETYSNDGDVTENHGYRDFWIVKLSATGEIQWQKSLGGSWEDEAKSIQQTSDGGFIVAGYTALNDGDVTGNHGGKDFWVVKLSAEGEIQWQKCLGGSKDDEAESIQQTNDGGFIVAGYTASKDGDITGNHGGKDFWVVKLSKFVGK
jgi:hypothetical protein